MTTPERPAIPIRLQDGQEIDGAGPIIIVGPNGSGKTRQSRTLSADVAIEFVNALRNTRVAPDLPAMGMETARNNYRSSRDQSRSQYLDFVMSEFDYLLSKLLGEAATAESDFVRRYREDRASVGDPPETPLSRLEAIWSEVFPGRALRWSDWKPLIRSTTTAQLLEYQGHQMSDGEKAALFIAARVLSADPGVVLVVDEPETHFHSLLAVRLWNVLEDARPDVRFVFVTHDLHFALSRQDARYVIASPTAGLELIDIDDDLPSDVAEALLGAASFSFYASRVVFCEGEQTSVDHGVLSAWFNGPDTVLRAVGSCNTVIRCVQALRSSRITQSLESIGVIDRDYHSENHLAALPDGVHPLSVHEIESLLALPSVVAAVASYTQQPFDAASYIERVRASADANQRQSIVIRRWKARVEPQLTALVATMDTKDVSLDDLVDQIPQLFEMSTWPFSPQTILAEEKSRVEEGIRSGDEHTLFSLIPGKQLVPLAAEATGLTLPAYRTLIIAALANGNDLATLGAELVRVFSDVLPLRAHSSPALSVLPAAGAT